MQYNAFALRKNWRVTVFLKKLEKLKLLNLKKGRIKLQKEKLI
jgi:hypothetical protein